jgi:hypothetical protein
VYLNINKIRGGQKQDRGETGPFHICLPLESVISLSWIGHAAATLH